MRNDEVDGSLVVRILLGLTTSPAAAQSGYQPMAVNDGGTITGTVKWNGPIPKMPTGRSTKTWKSVIRRRKKRSRARLIVGGNGGVANTVVFLKDITTGKAMDLPEGRQFLNQKPAATSRTLASGARQRHTATAEQ